MNKPKLRGAKSPIQPAAVIQLTGLSGHEKVVNWFEYPSQHKAVWGQMSFSTTLRSIKVSLELI